MKKLFGVLLSVVLLFSFACIGANAANTGALDATGNVRAGQNFTVKFTARGTVGAYSGKFDYDKSLVTLVSAANGGGQHWSSFTSNGDTVFAQRDTGTTDVVSFTAVFKVNDGVAAGTAIDIKFAGTIASDSEHEDSFSVSASKTVEATPNKDATLSSLKVENATLSPEFNPAVFSYSCGTVPFETKKLNISATANAKGAKFTISGATLKEGSNTITILVTAASGDTQTYTITCVREHDPNYVPSNNTKLSGIEVSEGKLSPEFNTDLKEYVLYLPYETTTVSIKAIPADEFAKSVENIEDQELEVGINSLVIKVTAEDGTVEEYTFFVVRMNLFEGEDSIGFKTAEKEEKDTDPVPEPGNTVKPDKVKLPAINFDELMTQWWFYAAIAVLSIFIGIIIALIIRKIGGGKTPDDDDDSDEDDDENNDEFNANPKVPTEEEIKAINAKFQKIKFEAEGIADNPEIIIVSGDEKKPEKQSAQKPAQPAQKPAQPAQKPAQPAQKPAQPAQKPAQPAQKTDKASGKPEEHTPMHARPQPSEPEAANPSSKPIQGFDKNREVLEKPENKIKVAMHRKDDYVDISSDSSMDYASDMDTEVDEKKVNELADEYLKDNM